MPCFSLSYLEHLTSTSRLAAQTLLLFIFITVPPLLSLPQTLLTMSLSLEMSKGLTFWSCPLPHKLLLNLQWDCIMIRNVCCPFMWENDLSYPTVIPFDDIHCSVQWNGKKAMSDSQNSYCPTIIVLYSYHKVLPSIWILLLPNIWLAQNNTQTSWILNFLSLLFEVICYCTII